MSCTNTFHFLEIFHFKHSRKQTFAGIIKDDGVIWASLQQYSGMDGRRPENIEFVYLGTRYSCYHWPCSYSNLTNRINDRCACRLFLKTYSKLDRLLSSGVPHSLLSRLLDIQG